MKACTCCREVKPVEAFSKNVRKTDGLASWCRVCTSAASRMAYRARLVRAGERQKERDRVNAFNKANPGQKAAASKKYATANPAAILAHNAKVKAAKKKRTPRWLSIDDLWLMRQAYEVAALRTTVFGFSWHVDHILPLQGKLVSGLHVPSNLRVIPAVDNWRKSNSFVIS